jgi:hypothetical protein
LGALSLGFDQRVRNGDFVLPDGTAIQPLRTAGGYRYFTIEMVKDVATCCYRHHCFSFKELKSVFRELAMDVHCDTGEGEIPG